MNDGMDRDAVTLFVPSFPPPITTTSLARWEHGTYRRYRSLIPARRTGDFQFSSLPLDRELCHDVVSEEYILTVSPNSKRRGAICQGGAGSSARDKQSTAHHNTTHQQIKEDLPPAATDLSSMLQVTR